MSIVQSHRRWKTLEDCELTLRSFEHLEPAIWLVGEEALGAGQVLLEASRQARQEGHRSVYLDLGGRRSHSFLGLKLLLLELESTVRLEKPEILRAYASEWRALFPHEYVNDPLFQGAKDLGTIALPASERRLSRESEQVFRLINRGVTLILDALDSCPSLQSGLLWVWARDLDACDRLTWHTLHHLHRRAHPRVRIVASLQAMPQDEALLPFSAETQPELIKRLLNDRREAERFLCHMYHDMAPSVIHMQPWTREDIQQHVNSSYPAWQDQVDSLVLWTGGAPLLLEAMLEKEPDLQPDQPAYWEASELEYMRYFMATFACQEVLAAAGLHPPARARFLLLQRGMSSLKPSLDEMRQAHQHIFDELAARGQPAGWSEEEYASHLCYHALQAGREVGLDYLATALSWSIHWGNYENILALDKQALRFAQRIPVSEEWLVRIWQWGGLVQAYLGNFYEAMEAYEQALKAATLPARRAQLYAYLSLLATKRLDDQSRAASLLETGMAEIQGLEDEESTIERAWLYNIQALSAFSQKQYAQAFNLCKQAYESIKHLHQDVLHLKVNLISNMSIVLEEMGRLPGALKVWHTFRQFLQGSESGLFKKIYYYREAGLILKLGEMQQAIEAFSHSFWEAEALRDSFHMDYIARDIGAIHYRENQWDEATHWFVQSERAARQAGNIFRAPGARFAQSLAAWHGGRQAEAWRLLREVLEEPSLSSEQRSACNTLLSAWQNDKDATATLAEIERREIGWPLTKLGKPFYLIHVPAKQVAK